MTDTKQEEKTYVFKDTEVRLTGRTAIRESNRRSTRGMTSTTKLVEITPTNVENGSWTRWIQQSELFEIQSP